MDFDRYLAALLSSWEALAAPHARASVRRGDGYAASMHPHSVLNNAVLLDAAALEEVLACYRGVAQYAVWSRDEDESAATALAAAGLERDITTRPMMRTLDDATASATGAVAVQADVDPGDVAELNGVSSDLLAGVPGIRAYGVAGRSGLVLLPDRDDVNISFVVTHPAARRRGLATAVLTAALADARSLGYSTASLQATPMAESMYAGLGFIPVGRWQEWVPARP